MSNTLKHTIIESEKTKKQLTKINEFPDIWHPTQASLQSTIQQIVRHELKESLTHHHAQIAAMIPPVDAVAMLRSGAATPVPQAGGEAQDYQAQIKALLKKRDIAGYDFINRTIL